MTRRGVRGSALGSLEFGELPPSWRDAADDYLLLLSHPYGVHSGLTGGR
jgi:hypothetical protein